MSVMAAVWRGMLDIPRYDRKKIDKGVSDCEDKKDDYITWYRLYMEHIVSRMRYYT